MSSFFSLDIANKLACAVLPPLSPKGGDKGIKRSATASKSKKNDNKRQRTK